MFVGAEEDGVLVLLLGEGDQVVRWEEGVRWLLGYRMRRLREAGRLKALVLLLLLRELAVALVRVEPVVVPGVRARRLARSRCP